jgi:hypothetical protein
LLLFVPLCTTPETVPALAAAPATDKKDNKAATWMSRRRIMVFRNFMSKMNPRKRATPGAN